MSEMQMVLTAGLVIFGIIVSVVMFVEGTWGKILSNAAVFVRRHHDSRSFILAEIILGIVIAVIIGLHYWPKHTVIQERVTEKQVFTDASATNLFAVAVYSTDSTTQYLMNTFYKCHSWQEAYGLAVLEEKARHPKATIIMYHVISP